jgi:futalosine hydrolase
VAPVEPRRILVVCAVAQECEALRLPSQIERLICGIGPVEAGMALARRLATERYDRILNIGVAGGFAPHVDVGSCVIVTDEYYADLGREDGGVLRLPDDELLLTHIALDSAFMHEPMECGATLGPAVTSATVTTSDERANVLRSRFAGVVSESMEGYALARAAAKAGVPLMQLRGISNRVGERSNSGWDLEAGLQAAARLTREVLESLRIA